MFSALILELNSPFAVVPYEMDSNGRDLTVLQLLV